MPWFHAGPNYRGEWSKDGYTERFKEEVRSIRTRFSTQKIQAGLDANGKWTPCTLRRSNVSVIVDKFEWGEIKSLDDYTPVFDITFRIGEEKEIISFLHKLVGRNTPEVSVFYQSKIRIVFNRYYPSTTPIIYNLKKRVVELDVSASHHTLSHGKLCVFGSSGDWDSDKDNACSAFLVGLEWCVLHYKNHGW